MLTLPEHLMILPVFVGVHTASALFLVVFCLFVLSLLFLLSLFVLSLYRHVFGPMIFLIIPSACCFGIRLPMYCGSSSTRQLLEVHIVRKRYYFIMLRFVCFFFLFGNQGVSAP